MAEEKKPKIDLKARLGKAGVNAPPAGVVPPPAAGGIPVPAPTPVGGPPGVPVGPPPGFGKGGAAPPLDPSNPLAAAVTPYRAPAPAAPPKPQRIEVDEAAVQQARSAARKQGLIAGLIGAVVLGVIGFIAGGAQETSKGRQKAVGDAKALAGDVTKAREQLKTLAEKIETGRTTLLKERKYPADLAKELGGINVDFDGGKLAGVRFSGFPQETTSGLIEFITAVQSVNDRKTAVSGLLTRLQKPITEQLAGGKTSISYVVLFGKRDPSNNPFALLAPLTTPIEVANPAQISLPAEFTATDPTTRANVNAPAYKSGGLDKASGVYVLPKSIEAACPSETTGQIAQLGSQLSKLINDIKGEQSAGTEEIIRDTQIGLLERADKLVVGLNKVQ